MKRESSAAALPRQYASVVDAAWGCKKVGGNPKFVLVALARLWSPDGKIMPSVEFLMDQVGVSRTCVLGCLSKLEKKRIIKIKRRPNKTSVYTLLQLDGTPATIGDLGSEVPGGDDSPPGLDSEPPPPASDPDSTSSQPGSLKSVPPMAVRNPDPGSLKSVPLEVWNRDTDLDPDPDPDPVDPLMDGSGSGSLRARARELPPPTLIDLRSWPLPDTWVGEWRARGFRAERLERQWRRYVLRFGHVPRPLTYIRAGFVDLCKWEARETSAPTVPFENAQRGANLVVPSSPDEKNGGLDVDEPTREACAEFGIDTGRMASEFVRSGEAARLGTGAADAFHRKVRAAVSAARHARRRANMTGAQLREDDERLSRARAAAAGAAA